MTGQERIRKALVSTLGWESGRANAARIYKGNGFWGYGWYIEDFGHNAELWGATIADVLSRIEDSGDERRQVG